MGKNGGLFSKNANSDHRSHGGEHAVGVLGEVFVTGRVAQVDAVTGVIELQHRRADRDAALLLQFHPVRRGGALVFARGHRAGELHRAAVEQEFFRQRGFSRVWMRDDGKRATLLNFFGNAHNRVAEGSRAWRMDKFSEK